MEDQGIAAPQADAPVSTVPPVVDTKPDASAAPESTEHEAPKGPQETPKWATSRIGELTRKEAQARTREIAAREEVKHWREIAERGGQQQQPGQQQPQQTTNARSEPQQQFDPNEWMNQATEVAKFNLRCDAVAEKGKAIEGFDRSLSTLQMAGLVTPENLPVILDASDAPEKVLHHLGSNPDLAVEILAMSPVRMAKAITKLEQSLTEQPAVSSAPNPLRPVKSGVTGSGPRMGSREWFEAETKRDAERRKR